MQPTLTAVAQFSGYVADTSYFYTSIYFLSFKNLLLNNYVIC